MSVQHIGIFISSRFAEFNDLRKAIARKLNDFAYVPLHPIELNDNGADISRLNLAIKTIEDNISEIQNQAISVKKQLLDAIDIFEKKAISLLSVVMPFTGKP